MYRHGPGDRARLNDDAPFLQGFNLFSSVQDAKLLTPQ